METYGQSGLFEVVSYDAGACSLENARAVVGHKLHYLFGLKGSQPTLRAEAESWLGALPPEKAEAKTEDIVGGQAVVRRLFRTTQMAGYLDWEHLQTVVRVSAEKVDYKNGNKVLEREDRYYISSLPSEQLSAEQWLLLIRRHWGVENNCHNTWDTVFEEDDRPWIEKHPQGMVVVQLLRRIAYNMLALFRSVTQRSEERRQTPWRDVVRWFYNALIAATDAQVEHLRPRRLDVALPC